MKNPRTQMRKNWKTQEKDRTELQKKKRCFLNNGDRIDIFSDIQVEEGASEEVQKTTHNMYDIIKNKNTAKDISESKEEIETGGDRSLEEDILDNHLYKAEREERGASDKRNHSLESDIINNILYENGSNRQGILKYNSRKHRSLEADTLSSILHKEKKENTSKNNGRERRQRYLKARVNMFEDIKSEEEYEVWAEGIGEPPENTMKVTNNIHPVNNWKKAQLNSAVTFPVTMKNWKRNKEKWNTEERDLEEIQVVVTNGSLDDKTDTCK